NLHPLLGYSSDEVVGVADFWEQLIHPDDRQHVATGMRDAVERQLPQVEHEYRLRRKDGVYRWFYTLTRVEYHRTTRPVTMLRYCLDIGLRKAAEEQVHGAHRFVDSIVENIPAMVVVKSACDL